MITSKENKPTHPLPYSWTWAWDGKEWFAADAKDANDLYVGMGARSWNAEGLCHPSQFVSCNTDSEV